MNGQFGDHHDPLALGSGNVASFYRGRRVVVAGASGFIGVNCALALRRAGAHVVGLVRRTPPPLVLRACTEIADFDLASADMGGVMRGASVLFDCLGYAKLAPSTTDPARMLDEECWPHINLFQDCARQPERPVVVHVSSRLVYGSPIRLPVDETHPLRPGTL